MTRQELKEIILRVITEVNEEEEAPVAGCIYQDAPDPCDATTFYGIGEEG